MSSTDVPSPGRSSPAGAATVRERGGSVAARLASAPRMSWLTLALMTTSSVASLRSAPTMAVYGLACVFLYLVPAVVFLLPTALVSAELASGWDGGVYRWVSEGLSKPLGFLAVWCQFAMTIFYYPSLLAYVASTIAYVVNPSLASNGPYTAVVIMVLYWTGVWVSSRGTKAVAGLSSWGLVIGTLIPGTLLVVLGMVFLGQGNASAAPMNAAHLFPQWTGLASLVLIVNNFLSYSGMEMNAVHVSSLRNPAKEFPRSMFTASGMVLLIFILPALAISWVVPSSQLSLTAGVMQAFDSFFQYFHIGWLTPVIAVALVAASLGGMLTWLAGPSRGLLMISRQEGYLPPFLQQLNKEGIQQNLLVTQGVVTTVIALAYALIPNVSSAYWIFSVITTQVYLIVYLLMFAAAIRLRRTQPDHPRGYRAPALVPICVIGLLSSAAAMAIGFVPSSQFGGGSVWVYVAIVGGGLLVLGALIPYLFLRLRKPEWRSPEAQAELAAQEAQELGGATPDGTLRTRGDDSTGGAA
ncbi:APC family permease [Kitasatospora sp. NBC_01560]|uniref:APC family permease n=1 Tax=Kitasatospora sp. NBC_01560 TaxID=2975965 RepID=UPI00386CAB41